MKRLANSRQIPKDKSICANKKYYDVLYAYLQSISEEDKITKKRTFSKKDINFSKLGVQFNMTRQTISTKFKNLKELGFIVEKDDCYELQVLEKDLAALIPFPTVKLLADALSENSISTYVYLLNRYLAAEEKPFQFTLEQIKLHIGICATTRSNDNTITNILYVLEKIGLIKYSMTTSHNTADSFQNVKTIYQIDQVSNVVIK